MMFDLLKTSRKPTIRLVSFGPASSNQVWRLSFGIILLIDSLGFAGNSLKEKLSHDLSGPGPTTHSKWIQSFLILSI